MSDIRIGENIGIIGGVRYDDFDAETFDDASDSTGTGSDDAVTYNLSGSYFFRPNDGTMIVPYVTCAESTFLEAGFADFLAVETLNPSCA